MERKLVKQGRNALTITLPAKWIKNNNLEAGDVVKIEEKNEVLALSTDLGKVKSETSVDVSGDQRGMRWHKIIAKYIEGYDIITVHHDDAQEIQEIAQQFIGMMIDTHSPKTTVLKSIIAVPESNVKSIIRRAAHMFLQQAHLLKEVAEGKAKFEELRFNEMLMDSHINYCMRFLTKYHDTKHAYKYFLLCSVIEQAGDELRRVGKVIGNDVKLAETIIEGITEYNKNLFSADLKQLYLNLREFRNKIPTKTFAHGLSHSLAEMLYNNIGYLVGEK